MIEQRTDAWFKARLGRVTASRVSDVMATTKTGPAAQRANYQAQLIVERLTGQPQDTYQNAAMLHGIATEPEARIAYEFRSNNSVEEIGFMPHPAIPMSGASPDGMVGVDGLLEIKCPQSAAHIETLLRATAPTKYLYQMQWQMACTARAWCDFVSYDPRMPEAMRLFVQRVHRDDNAIAELEATVVEFLAELDARLFELLHRYGGAAT